MSQLRGLRLGATHVYRLEKNLYACGDEAHCSTEAIQANIRALASRLQAMKGAWMIGKGYDDGIYEAKGTKPVAGILEAMSSDLDLGGGTMYRVEKDLSLTPVTMDGLKAVAGVLQC